MSSRLPENEVHPKDIFGIDEQPFKTEASEFGDDFEPRQMLELDIKGLLQQIAELEFSRAEIEKQHLAKNKRLMLSIVEVLDGFERVFANIHAKQDLLDPKTKKWVGNFRTIQRMVNGILVDQGVVAIESLDGAFDPQWHKITQMVLDSSKPDGSILGETLKGYVWRNAILRKAEVIVSVSTEGELQGHLMQESD